MKKVIFVLFWVRYLTNINCNGAVDSNYIADGNDIKAVASGNTDLAFDLYDRLKGNAPKGNLFFSPYSISNALALAYGGTRGETQKQMAETLHFTLPNERFYPAFLAHTLKVS